MSENRVVNYSPAGPVVKDFLQNSSFVRLIQGPLGSGKSTACVLEILRRAKKQVKSPDGIRRTRWAVVRNSYPELKSTTMKTWGQWAPGKISGVPPFTYWMETDELSIEVLFLALDHPDDAKKVLSLEVTGVWINEAREIPKSIVDGLSGRVGRYPSVNEGGCTWSGIIMDTNPPDTSSWIYKMCEIEKPEGWAFFKQPSGVSEHAENIKNLPKNYYKRIMSGKDEDWIKVYVHGEYGFLVEGNAVFSNFRDRFHVASEIIEPSPAFALQIGVDFGLTPAAIIGQKLSDGRWLILDELVATDCGIIRFAELLSSYIAENYPDFNVANCWGDPAGNARSQSDERTSLEIMNTHTGWKWRPAPSNDLTMRLEVVRNALNRVVDGNPGFLISPKCATLRKGMAGGYHYKLLKSGDGTQTHSEPNKNEYSHPCDALQYLLLGGGEHDVVLNKNRNKMAGPRLALGRDYKIFQ